MVCQQDFEKNFVEMTQRVAIHPMGYSEIEISGCHPLPNRNNPL